MEPPRELVLVVAEDAGIVDGDQHAQPDRGGHLAVGEVVHDFTCAPLVGTRPRVQFLIAGAGERFRDDPVAFLVLVDEFPARVLVHDRLTPWSWQCRAPPPPARCWARGGV